MQKVICIVGPTGVGKTKLSIELAKKLNGEIINADSTQVYIGLDIATAKVKEEEKDGIPHHLFDIKEITEPYTVYDYQKDCRKKIEEISSRGHLPILVGGTGLYLKAALYNYEFEEMKVEEKEYPKEKLYEMVCEKDPNNKIHPNNYKRLLRAYQYMEQTGEPFSEKEKSDIPLYDIIWIGLTTDREILYERINNRVYQMLEEGLEEEARKLYDSNIRSKAVLTPIGYREFFSYFDGKITKEEAISNIQKESRHYAKRQYTWFQNQVPVKWVSVNFSDFSETIKQVEEMIKDTK